MAALRKVPDLLRTKPVKVRGGQSYMYLRTDVEAYLASRNPKGGRRPKGHLATEREWRTLLVAELLEDLLRLEGTSHLWLCDLIRYRKVRLFQTLIEVDELLGSNFMDGDVRQRFRLLVQLPSRSTEVLAKAEAHAAFEHMSARERAQWHRFIRGAVAPAVNRIAIPPGRGGIRL